jgi:hypothetical protein
MRWVFPCVEGMERLPVHAFSTSRTLFNPFMFSLLGPRDEHMSLSSRCTMECESLVIGTLDTPCVSLIMALSIQCTCVPQFLSTTLAFWKNMVGSGAVVPCGNRPSPALRTVPCTRFLRNTLSSPQNVQRAVSNRDHRFRRADRIRHDTDLRADRSMVGSTGSSVCISSPLTATCPSAEQDELEDRHTNAPRQSPTQWTSVTTRQRQCLRSSRCRRRLAVVHILVQTMIAIHQILPVAGHIRRVFSPAEKAQACVP